MESDKTMTYCGNCKYASSDNISIENPILYCYLKNDYVPIFSLCRCDGLRLTMEAIQELCTEHKDKAQSLETVLEYISENLEKEN